MLNNVSNVISFSFFLFCCTDMHTIKTIKSQKSTDKKKKKKKKSLEMPFRLSYYYAATHPFFHPFFFSCKFSHVFVLPNVMKPSKLPISVAQFILDVNSA